MPTLLSISTNYSKVEISDEELNQHCLIIGTTGSGKTNTILNFVDSACMRNLPCIYLDGKGSPELIDKLKIIATKYHKIFKVFTLRPNSTLSNIAAYNPFSSGNATEWKNRIMSLFAEAQSKGQEHFSLAEQNYINFVSNVLYGLSQQKQQPVDLRVLLSFLENPELLQKAANGVDPLLAKKLNKLHKDVETAHMAGDVIRLLELFIYSGYGELLDTADKNCVISLRESILGNELILFLFDASAYPEDTKKMAKMVINDLNSCFSGFSQFTKAFCIFDEFGSYASSNLAESISLQRSQGMHAIIGTQSISTVKLKSNDSRRIAEELIACCNSFIIHRINHVEDAELFARVIGTHEVAQYTATIYANSPHKQETRAIGNTKLVEKFKISPQQIKDLKLGEAIVHRKAGNREAVKTVIRDVFAPMVVTPVTVSKPRRSFVPHIVLVLFLGGLGWFMWQPIIRYLHLRLSTPIATTINIPHSKIHNKLTAEDTR